MIGTPLVGREHDIFAAQNALHALSLGNALAGTAVYTLDDFTSVAEEF